MWSLMMGHILQRRQRYNFFSSQTNVGVVSELCRSYLGFLRKMRTKGARSALFVKTIFNFVLEYLWAQAHQYHEKHRPPAGATRAGVYGGSAPDRSKSNLNLE